MMSKGQTHLGRARGPGLHSKLRVSGEKQGSRVCIAKEVMGSLSRTCERPDKRQDTQKKRMNLLTVVTFGNRNKDQSQVR